MVMFALYSDHICIMLGSLRVPFWIILGSLSNRFGIILRSFWDEFDIVLESFWDCFVIIRNRTPILPCFFQTTLAHKLGSRPTHVVGAVAGAFGEG